MLLYRIQSLVHHSFFLAYFGHGAPSLRLYEYLSLTVLVAADLAAEEIVGAQVPLPVPAVFFDCLDHFLHFGFGPKRFALKSEMTAKLCILAAAEDELPCYHQRLGLAAFALVLSGLERLVRVIGETVEVEAVIPVSPAYERKSMRSQMVQNMVEAHAQVFHKRKLGPRAVVEGHRFLQNGEVARFLEICHGAEDEPKRIVVEAASYVVVSPFGQRLVLVVA